jgi:molybdopterin-guanine dinucleotide biosynthesis protein B
MKVLGLAGWSGAGKTTLIERLLPALIGRGLSVSTIKHAHHTFDIDRSGKDSFRHRAAGATEVLVTSDTRFALMHENRGRPEPALEQLLAKLEPVDLVLVEGFRGGAHEKIEVYRQSLGKPLLAEQDRHIVAIAAEPLLQGLAQPCFPLADIVALTDFIIKRVASTDRA